MQLINFLLVTVSQKHEKRKLSVSVFPLLYVDSSFKGSDHAHDAPGAYTYTLHESKLPIMYVPNTNTSAKLVSNWTISIAASVIFSGIGGCASLLKTFTI